MESMREIRKYLELNIKRKRMYQNTWDAKTAVRRLFKALNTFFLVGRRQKILTELHTQHGTRRRAQSHDPPIVI